MLVYPWVYIYTLNWQLSAIILTYKQLTEKMRGSICLLPVSCVNGAQIPYRFKTLKLPVCSEQKCFHYFHMNHYLGREKSQKNMVLSECWTLCNLGSVRVCVYTWIWIWSNAGTELFMSIKLSV